MRVADDVAAGTGAGAGVEGGFVAFPCRRQKRMHRVGVAKEEVVVVVAVTALSRRNKKY